jgi:hypothetical protein
VFGATKNGTIHVWDLRGGRASGAFQSHNEVGSVVQQINLMHAAHEILQSFTPCFGTSSLEVMLANASYRPIVALAHLIMY